MLIKNAKILGTKANELGMKLGYHNHDFEFVKIDGRCEIVHLKNFVDAEN